MGQVVSVTRGRDGFVRDAEVKIGAKIYTRPIFKLIPLVSKKPSAFEIYFLQSLILSASGNNIKCGVYKFYEFYLFYQVNIGLQNYCRTV